MTRFIPSILVWFFLVISVVIVNAQVPSNTCTYVCPPTDKKGTRLIDTIPIESLITCVYLSGGLCTYDPTADGELIDDSDAGECPHTAVDQCPTRRDNIVKMLKHRAEARAAQPQTSRPQFMGARGALGKKRAELKMGKR